MKEKKEWAEEEKRFLYNPADQYGIYQLREGESTQNILYLPMCFMRKKNFRVLKENYKLIYVGKMEEGMNPESIYIKLNNEHPDNFTGHSLSVSDVIVICRDGEITSYYVDACDFCEVPDFIPRTDKREETATITVAECGEFKILGDIYEGITDVDEALHIFLHFLRERKMGSPSISVHVRKSSASGLGDVGYELFIGGMIDLTALPFFPEIIHNNTAMKMIAEIVERIPKKFEVRGTIDVKEE